MFVYIVTKTGKMLPANSRNGAKEAILARYPLAFFGNWMKSRRGRTFPVWRNAGSELRFEMGETHDENKPIADLHEQNWQVVF